MIIRMLFKRYQPALVTTLMVSFAVFVIPALAIVLTVSQYQSEHSIRTHLDAELGRTKLDTDCALDGFFRPVVNAAAFLSESVALDQSEVRDPSFNAMLYQVLSKIDQVVNVNIAFQEGYFRAFGRIDAEILARHPEVPPQARWMAQVSQGTEGHAAHIAERTFYGDYPEIIESTSTEQDIDYLDSEAFVGAKAAGGTFFSNAHIGRVSGKRVISVGQPIFADRKFIGAVTVSASVKELSSFLLQNRMSINTESFILDSQNNILAASALADTLRQGGVARNAETLERRVVAIDDLRSGPKRSVLEHSFLAELDGVEYNVSIFPIKSSLGLQMRALVVTPLDDFVGDLRRSRRNFALLVALLLLVEAFLIVRVSRRMARKVRGLTGAIESIRAMHFDGGLPGRDTAYVQELSELQQGISLLQSALRSFALYVPLGVVRRLVEEGRPIAPGVERRDLTVLFCDLENFSTLAQSIPAEELLEYSTAYFSIATEAITRHGGTVDKFIGDAVMAFWGAPQPVDDHAVRACRAAVDLVRGLESRNAEWRAEGRRTLRVRVGVNSSSVLVGNIGSPDRLSYTAIGDGVNVASRLEGKNKDLGTSICISDSTYELAKASIVARPLKPISVKGRQGEFMVYELLDVVPAQPLAQAAPHI